MARIALPWTEFGIHIERFVSFVARQGVVVVFKRQPRQQFLGFDQMGIGFERLVRQLAGFAAEFLGLQ